MNEVYKNRQFTKPADEILEAIAQYHIKIKGKRLTKAQLLKEAQKVLEGRFE